MPCNPENLNLVLDTLVKVEGVWNPSSSPLSPTHAPAVAWELSLVSHTHTVIKHRFLRCKTEVWERQDRAAGPGRSA